MIPIIPLVRFLAASSSCLLNLYISESCIYKLESLVLGDKSYNLISRTSRCSQTSVSKSRSEYFSLCSSSPLLLFLLIYSYFDPSNFIQRKEEL